MASVDSIVTLRFGLLKFNVPAAPLSSCKVATQTTLFLKYDYQQKTIQMHLHYTLHDNIAYYISYIK